jgi:hypothetical protein
MSDFAGKTAFEVNSDKFVEIAEEQAIVYKNLPFEFEKTPIVAFC